MRAIVFSILVLLFAIIMLVTISNDAAPVGLVIIYLLVGSQAYLFPFWIAFFRDHPNKGLIFLTNLFGGWSGFGWIGCLFWACSPIVYDED